MDTFGGHSSASHKEAWEIGSAQQMGERRPGQDDTVYMAGGCFSQQRFPGAAQKVGLVLGKK